MNRPPQEPAHLPCKRIAMFAPGERPAVLAEAERLRDFVREHAEVVLFDQRFSERLDELAIDLVIVVGGDGSILRAVRHMGYQQLPVMGVNLGKLGFLADLQTEEFRDVFPMLCGGGIRTTEHLMFEAAVFREEALRERTLGLNEATIAGGPPFQILNIDMYVDEELVTRYRCDGLIVSSPVGSTAHNLSAGGPILRKDLQAFVISPIGPHTLTNRPVVDSAERVFELVAEDPSDTTHVIVDGRVLCRLEGGDRLRIQRAAPVFQLVDVPGRTYYRTLREKLGWGGGLPNLGAAR